MVRYVASAGRTKQPQLTRACDIDVNRYSSIHTTGLGPLYML